MPLISLWKSAPDAVAQMTIQQIVGNAGDGRLLDNSVCSTELREYLRGIPSADLARYVEQCLGSSFDKGGMVLQDLVNELGRRLEYDVEDGRYQGVVNAIGYDGLWLSVERHAIVVEVKTTDAYRISLDTIAKYRDRLVQAGRIGALSSVLIVVGRQDTGELEAQVRGSRHAWDVRLISADALVKLVQLKENTEAADTGRKIRDLLTPMEYTRLDRMIDVMFTAAKDVEVGTAAVQVDDETEEAADAPLVAPVAQSAAPAKGTWQFTDSKLLQAKREAILTALGERTGVRYIQKSPAQAWDASHAKRVVCTLSKRYSKTPAAPYWYAYHPPWHQFLREGVEAYLLLGCMDLPFAFALPLPVFTPLLDALNTTGEHYWHVKIGQAGPDRYTLQLPKWSDALPIDEYRLPLAG